MESIVVVRDVHRTQYLEIL